ncbi:MAG: WD40 repeat domain-containing protein [Erythrobacter sp.]|uniref:WD40 repeat domain-containing protein n=1 Tax=Erythrobacter sp. TaxID=1042 RepID=UPI003296FAEB
MGEVGKPSGLTKRKNGVWYFRKRWSKRYLQDGESRSDFARSSLGYVTWYWNGDIRFWSSTGNQIKGNALNGLHNGKVWSVAWAGCGAVSRGVDGSLRHWEVGSEVRPKYEARKAHDGSVDGLVSWESGYVSWKRDHEIRVWNQRLECDATIVPPSGFDDVSFIGDKMIVLGKHCHFYPSPFFRSDS